MAGAGYKLFNTGDVLTAAQVNTYLQEQAVMRFANAAARTTALSGVLAEGMVSYLDDTNVVQVYNGSAWVNVGEAGDITAVTAGTGISGGGTSGDVTITNSMATAIDAKGDLIAGTAGDSFARLAVGADHSFLQALASESTGLRYVSDWTSYTPTLTNITQGNGTVIAKYMRIGKIVTVRFQFTLGSTSAMGTFPYISLPFSATGNTAGLAVITDTGTATYFGIMQASGPNGIFYIANTAGTYMTAPDISATVPMTWTNTDILAGILTYEVA